MLEGGREHPAPEDQESDSSKYEDSLGKVGEKGERRQREVNLSCAQHT